MFQHKILNRCLTGTQSAPTDYPDVAMTFVT